MNIRYFYKKIPGDYNHQSRHAVCSTESISIEFIGFPYQAYSGSYKNKAAEVSHNMGEYYVNVRNCFPNGTSEVFAHEKFIDKDSAFEFAFYNLIKE